MNAAPPNLSASRHSARGILAGVGFGLGGQQNGFTIEIAAGGGNGKVEGTSTTHRETQVSGSEKLSIESGRGSQARRRMAGGSSSPWGETSRSRASRTSTTTRAARWMWASTPACAFRRSATGCRRWGRA